MLVNILLVAGGLYAAAVAALYLLQDGMIFFPQRAVVVRQFPDGTRPLSIEVDNAVLSGWLHTGAPPAGPLLVYFGGNAEEVSENLQDVARVPHADWAFINYRGYGHSTGRPTQDALFADALRVLDALVAETGVDLGRVVLFGRSLGSGVAVHVASQREVAGVVLVTPYDSIRSIAQAQYPIFPVRLLLKHPFDSLSRAKTTQIPGLFLVAGRDSIIPPSHSRRLFEAWAGTKRWELFDAASHNDIQSFPDYWRRIEEFVREVAPERTADG